MAQQNELIPNTSTNHQGRLAYVPDDMLPPEVVGPIFDAAQEQSVMLQLGRRIPMGYGGTVVPTTTKRPEVGQIGIGKANSQREGYLKPLSGAAWGTREIMPLKFGTIITASEEMVINNPQGLWTQMIADLPLACARAIDMAVMHGTRPDTGGALLGVTSTDILGNTVNSVNLNTGSTTVYEDLVTGYRMVANNRDVDFDGWVFDKSLAVDLAIDSVPVDTVGAYQDPRKINLAADVRPVLGYPARFSRAVAGDLGAASDTDIRGFGGDFSQFVWGFADQIRYKTTRDATLTDGTNTVSMFQTNQVAVLVEFTFGWAIGDLDGIVKFTKPGGS